MRILYRIFSCIFFVLFFTSLHAQKLYNLEGRIFNLDTNQPVAGVSVSIKAIGSTAISDSSGHYFFGNLPAAIYDISFSIIGYQNKFRSILLNKNLSEDIFLKPQIHELPELIVNQKKEDDNVKLLRTGVITLNLKQLKKAPIVLGEPDIIKSLQLQPGVSTVGEGAGGFNVRGGSADENLILLDGAPVFNTSHLLGFFTNVNPDIIQSATLYKAGIPAEFGGRISSLLQMNIDPGNTDSMNIKGGIAPIASRIFAEGPLIKNKLTYSIGARLAYPDWIINLLHNAKKNRAFFLDANAKLQYILNPNNRFFISAYTSYDHFKFPQDTSYSWLSALGTIQYSHLFSNHFSVKLEALQSNYSSDINGLTPYFKFKLSSSIQQQEIKSDFLYTSKKHAVSWGGNFTYLTISPGRQMPNEKASSINNISIQKQYAHEWGAYISDDWKISNSLSFEPGVRYTLYQNIGKANIYEYENGVPLSKETITDTLHYKRGQVIKTVSYLEPRLLLRILLTKNSSVKISYNRLHQYLHLISNTLGITPVDFWQLSNSYTLPEAADQYTFGYYHNFEDNMFAFSAEVYYKKMRNLVEYKDGAVLLLNPAIETDLLKAKGKAYGIELSLQKTRGKLTGMLAYTYARSLQAVVTPYPSEEINNGNYYSSLYDKPNSIICTAQLVLGKGWTAAANFIYTTGRPATFPDGRYYINNTPLVNYSRRNADRLPDYDRLDIAFSYDSRRYPQQKKYSIWNFSFYNIYARKNPYSIYFSSNQGVVQAYRLSVFGTIIPSITWNFYF